MSKSVRIVDRSRECKAKLDKIHQQNLDAAAIYVVNHIRNSFGPPGSPSEPWHPPNTQSGMLKANIGWDKEGDRMNRRVGTGIGNRQSVGYAQWLEFGTRKMQPRPFLRPAIFACRTAITKILARKGPAI